MNNTYNPAGKSLEQSSDSGLDPERKALMQRAELLDASIYLIDEAVSKVDWRVSRDVLAEFTDKQVRVQPDGVISMEQPEVIQMVAALPVEELAQSALSMSQVQTPAEAFVSKAQEQVDQAYAPDIKAYLDLHPRGQDANLAGLGYQQVNSTPNSFTPMREEILSTDDKTDFGLAA